MEVPPFAWIVIKISLPHFQKSAMVFATVFPQGPVPALLIQKFLKNSEQILLLTRP